VSVLVLAGKGELTLTVRDDGRGIGASPGGGHGLRNMRARADELGGLCTVAPGEPSGTVLCWRVPL
jgi:signal transduction histidine kinase